MNGALDHLVVLAPTLAAGAAWCETTLGVVPDPGGAHPLMGTHNRLLALGGTAFPGAYFEIIARDPAATPTRAAGLARWFDIDDPTLAAQVASEGPQLVHWVARVPDLAVATASLAALGIDRGRALAAHRDTPAGRLAWQITVRDDGQRLFGGCLPTLIEWQGPHPTDALSPAGLALQRLLLAHPDAHGLQQALAAIGLDDHPGIAVQPARQAQLVATLATPAGPTTLGALAS